VRGGKIEQLFSLCPTLAKQRASEGDGRGLLLHDIFRRRVLQGYLFRLGRGNCNRFFDSRAAALNWENKHRGRDRRRDENLSLVKVPEVGIHFKLVSCLDHVEPHDLRPCGLHSSTFGSVAVRIENSGSRHYTKVHTKNDGLRNPLVLLGNEAHGVARIERQAHKVLEA
jgi:hypothetical protein